MPRKSRDYFMSNFYHLMVQGDEKKFIFNEPRGKNRFIYLLKRNAFRNDVKLIAYCVMDNHAHILVCSKELARISKMMSQCNTSYGLYYSKKRGNIGHVFRERYRSEPIYTKFHLINCIKYIHENPVKAGMVKFCNDYTHSSFNEYLNKTDFFDELKSFCDLTEEEYANIIIDSHTETNYMDSYYESVSAVIRDIKSKYDLDNVKEDEIVIIYTEMKKRCQITKTQLANLLKMERTKISRILHKNGCP